MNVKIHSGELNRIMKVLSGCVDPRFTQYSNVEISHVDNKLTFRATNGQQYIRMTSPMMGEDSETFCVDGKKLSSVAGIQKGDVNISTDGKIVTVRGTGRTRLTQVNMKLGVPASVDGHTVSVNGDAFMKAVGKVAYAISHDDTRVILTGMLLDVEAGKMTMVALDGFQMSKEVIDCDGDDMRVVVPSTMIRRICDCIEPSDTVTITTDGTRICARTAESEVIGGALVGEFIDYKRLTPDKFATATVFSRSAMQEVLNGAGVTGVRLIQLNIAENEITFNSRSEETEFEADVPCITHGDWITIAFNRDYLMNALKSISEEEAVMRLNSAVSAAVIEGKDSGGMRLLLPVRTR